MRKADRPTGSQRETLRAEREQAAALRRDQELVEARAIRERESRLREGGSDEAERRELVRSLLHDADGRAMIDAELVPPLEALAKDENDLTLALLETDTLDTAAAREVDRVYAWVSAMEHDVWPPGFEVAKRLLDAYDDASASSIRELPIHWISAERVYAHARSFPSLAMIPRLALASVARRLAVLLFNRSWLLPYRQGRVLDSSPWGRHARSDLEPSTLPVPAPASASPVEIAPPAVTAPPTPEPPPAEAALAAGELVMCLDCGGEKPMTGPCPGCEPPAAPGAPPAAAPAGPEPAAPPRSVAATLSRPSAPRDGERARRAAARTFPEPTLVLDYTGSPRPAATMAKIVDKQSAHFRSEREVINYARLKEPLVFLRGEALEVQSAESRRTGLGRVVKSVLEAGTVVEVMSPSRFDRADIDRKLAAGVQLVTIRWQHQVRLIQASCLDLAHERDFQGAAP